MKRYSRRPLNTADDDWYRVCQPPQRSLRHDYGQTSVKNSQIFGESSEEDSLDFQAPPQLFSSMLPQSAKAKRKKNIKTAKKKYEIQNFYSQAILDFKSTDAYNLCIENSDFPDTTNMSFSNLDVTMDESKASAHEVLQKSFSPIMYNKSIEFIETEEIVSVNFEKLPDDIHDDDISYQSDSFSLSECRCFISSDMPSSIPFDYSIRKDSYTNSTESGSGGSRHLYCSTPASGTNTGVSCMPNIFTGINIKDLQKKKIGTNVYNHVPNELKDQK